MVHITNICSELWAKSRTVLQNRSTRRKRNKKNESAAIITEKSMPQQFLRTNPLRKTTHTCTVRKTSFGDESLDLEDLSLSPLHSTAEFDGDNDALMKYPNVSPIWKSPRRPQEDFKCRRNLEDRFVVNAFSFRANPSLISEMYRARITPDKMLAKTIFKEQEDFFAEPIYATPMKTIKTESPMESQQNDVFIRLKEEANYQCKIMRQASKALEVSRRSDLSTYDIRGQVEAERILLTANCKYEQIMEEIRQTHYEMPVESKHLGTIEVSNVCVEFSSNFCPSQSGWFVLVLMNKTRTLCSSPVDVSINEGNVTFNQTFKFEYLDSNFEITGKVFSLPHCHLTKKSDNRFFTTRMRRSTRKYRYRDVYTRDFVENSIITSSFAPLGQFKLDVNALKDTVYKMTLHQDAPLSGALNLKMQLTEMHIKTQKHGLLNLRADSDHPTMWERRWCTLSDTTLQFWKSPLDNAPTTIIDLTFCRRAIDDASRAECPRAKTLCIATSRGVHYIHMDTMRELKEWKRSLNQVYYALSEWKLLRT